MQVAHALGRWVIFSRGLTADTALTTYPDDQTKDIVIGLLDGRDLDWLARAGRKGREDAAILESADVAVVARDTSGAVLHFRCAALSSLHHPGLPFPIRVADGEAFGYHAETARAARGRGLARRGLTAMMEELQSRGVERVEAHTTERHHTVRRYYAEAGFAEVGWLLTTSYGSSLHWITAAQRPFFADPPLFHTGGLTIHAEHDADVARLTHEFDGEIASLRENAARVALLGSGDAADELLTLVPALKPLIIAVAYSDPRR